MGQPDYFMGIVTLVVGLFVFVVYWLRRRAYRQDAANVLLGEVRTAQDQLQKVQDHVARFQAENDPDVEVGLIPAHLILMPDQSWSKYKHLFTRKIDRHTYDALANFYEKTVTYDRAVDYNNGAFAKNEESIRSNVARMALDQSITAIDELEDPDIDAPANQERIEQMHREIDSIRTLYLRNKILEYQPRKPVQDAKAQLMILGTLDMSVAVIRLKQLSGTKN